jgi:uncharacterized protein YecT (DUF1311 family)
MKYLMMIVCVLTALSPVAARADMTEITQSQYKKANDSMLASYNQLLQVCQKDPTFIKRLKDVQTSWTRLRDAQADLKFSYKASEIKATPMLRAIYLQQLTERHDNDLKELIQYAQIGGVCAGAGKPADAAN